MPTLTALIPQERVKDRVNVFLDGRFAFSLNIETVIKRGLRVGTELSANETSTLLVESEKEKLVGKILNFLSYRPRSRKEIHDRLYRYTKSFGDHQERLIQVVEEYLDSHALIDDRAFARWYLEQRQTFRPRSSRMLRSELFSKGVPRDIVDEVLAELAPDPQASIRAIIEKKLRGKTKLDEKALTRLQGQLLRLGFAYDEVKQALYELASSLRVKP